MPRLYAEKDFGETGLQCWKNCFEGRPTVTLSVVKEI